MQSSPKDFDFFLSELCPFPWPPPAPLCGAGLWAGGSRGGTTTVRIIFRGMAQVTVSIQKAGQRTCSDGRYNVH